MESVDNELNSNSLNVPPKLPLILKQFCKAAIRTQPYDLLKWSSAYFNALAEGAEPPIKFRLEYPLFGSITDGLTLGFIKVLLRQFGADYNKVLSVETILRQWDDLCLNRRDLNLIMIIGKFRRKCQVKKFLSIAVGLLGSSLYDTMLMICDLFTMEPDGGSSLIPVNLFMEIYSYLAGRRCDGERLEPDDDPSEFIVQETSEAITPELSEESNKINAPVTSQEFSDADPNADIEFNFKDDSCIDINNRKESAYNISALTDRSNNSSKDKVQNDCEKEIIESEVHEKDYLVSSNREENFIKLPKIPMSDDEKTITSDEQLEMSGEKRELNRSKKKLMINRHWLTHYPIVPGIGPRLTAEEVATVAEWMTECSKIQEGMVGPRNIRHFQCPPLDRHKIPKS
ncbi:hypothetical protein PV328_000387 [Microctonus aethiopoides]|uniref:Ropporin-1-like protein n=1 Tax=Microctonus aethiopoides TaxID=144406 RepID=A0AA39FV51_9HYME|nr:hypothetical protein PV328_000387 [Microctonus aethiopoides]